MNRTDALAVLEVADRNRLESLLMDFDQAWEPDRMGKFVDRMTAGDSRAFERLALSELVKIDLQRQWSAGKRKRLEAYLQELPALGTSATVDAELILAEFIARRTVKPKLKLGGYESRFPNQFARLKELAIKTVASEVKTIPPDGSEPLAQASIDTSRLDAASDTTVGRPSTPPELPEEFGRYRILRELGAGAMGRVYLAHDSQLDRHVAIKTPSFQGASDADLITRFYREARAAAKLQHRNICPIF